MKKLLILSFIVTLFSCSNTPNDKADESKTNETTTPGTNAADQNAEKGLALVAKSDCFTCHKVAEASTGPSYTDVAARYQNNAAVVDSLSDKIINGGVGNWGTVPMISHPSLSKEDAKTMVEYVLSLKK